MKVESIDGYPFHCSFVPFRWVFKFNNTFTINFVKKLKNYLLSTRVGCFFSKNRNKKLITNRNTLFHLNTISAYPNHLVGVISPGSTEAEMKTLIRKKQMSAPSFQFFIRTIFKELRGSNLLGNFSKIYEEIEI